MGEDEKGRQGGTMNSLFTERLELIPCSYVIGKQIFENRDELRSALGIGIPDDWPQEDLQDFLVMYLEALQSDPLELGWGFWLIVHTGEQEIIGDIGFKGRPDGEGNIEIGYSLVPKYRRQGYCHEASKKLVSWAFEQKGVNKVLAECDDDNLPSERILEKLGMVLKERSGPMLKWELTKTLWE